MTRKTLPYWLLALGLIATAAATAQVPAPVGPPVVTGRPRPGRPGPGRQVPEKVKLFEALNQSNLVFKAQVQKVVMGPVGMSYPPMYTMRITFKGLEMLKGDAPKPTTFHYSNYAKKAK